jgi:polar amino acid transport system substrate-binding protein
MLRKLTFSSLLFLVTAWMLGCTQGLTRTKIQKDKRIYIGAVPFEPPLLYQQAGVLVGSEANLAQRIAEKFGQDMGLELEPFWITRSYKTLAAALINEEVDFIISVYAITEEREKEIQFSNPYYTSELVLIINPAHKPNLRPNDLSEQKIGVREGTGVAVKTTTKYSSSTIVPFETLDDAILALRRGEVDAVVDDKILAGFSLATAPGATHLEILPSVIDTVECAVAVRKGDSVINEVNEVIAEISSLYAGWTE